MQLIAVLGSLTAGEIAFNAISTICRTPNSTSCCIVRIGPMTNADRISLLSSAVRRLLRETVKRGAPSGAKCPIGRNTRTRNLCALANSSRRSPSMKQI
jgi:hypothetical protein